MMKVVILLVLAGLVVSQSQQQPFYWQHQWNNQYQNWTRSWISSNIAQNISVSDYFFRFMPFPIAQGMNSTTDGEAQNATTTTTTPGSTMNLRRNIIKSSGIDQGQIPTSYSGLDGETMGPNNFHYAYNPLFGANNAWNGRDGEWLGNDLVANASQWFSMSYFDGEFMAAGIDSDGFIWNGQNFQLNQTKPSLFFSDADGELQNRLLYAPYFLAAYHAYLTRFPVFLNNQASNNSMTSGANTSGQVNSTNSTGAGSFGSASSAVPVYINVELLNVDQPKDYVDPFWVSEAYEIIVNSAGNVTFRCSGYVSFLRALEGFLELFNPIQQLGAPQYLQEFPAYPWRGLMLDTARHFLYANTIMDTIRGMRIACLNILHLHLTDSQSFPFQLTQYPDVTAAGAFSEEQVYSVATLEELVLYGQLYGVIIVPEFDTPDHTASWALDGEFAQLNACGSLQPTDWAQYCDQPPCGSLDPTLNLTYSLVNSVLSEGQQIFPAKFVHLGGDAYLNNGCWQLNSSISTWMQNNNITSYPELFDYYFNKVNSFIAADRRRIYWNDNNLNNLSYIDGSIIQYAQSSDASDLSGLQNITNQVILTPNDLLFLECNNDPLLGAQCPEKPNWFQIYNMSLSSFNLGNRLIGAEAALWSQLVSYENLDIELWPRGLALGLNLWYGSAQTNNYGLSYIVQKLAMVNQFLQQDNVASAPVASEYCLYNPSACFFS